MPRAGLTADSEHAADQCVGTFRWSSKKKLPRLPSSGGSLQQVSSHRGWGGVLQSRGGSALMQQARSDPAIVDGLSYPVTLLFALEQLGISRAALAGRCRGRAKDVVLNIVVAGAAEKAEERVLRKSNYWQEVGRAFEPSSSSSSSSSLNVEVRLWLTGPEISKSTPSSGIGIGSSTRVFLVRGTVVGLLQKNPTLDAPPWPRAAATGASRANLTVVFGFNPGFGSGNKDMLTGWLPTLRFLSRRNILTAFSQANDYSDLRGELLVLRTFVAPRWVLAPARNRFPCATFVHEPGKRETSWSCGNSFLYAFQGTVGAANAPATAQFDRPIDCAPEQKMVRRIVKTLQDYDRRGGGKQTTFAFQDGELGDLDDSELLTFVAATTAAEQGSAGKAAAAGSVSPVKIREEAAAPPHPEEPTALVVAQPPKPPQATSTSAEPPAQPTAVEDLPAAPLPSPQPSDSSNQPKTNKDDARAEVKAPTHRTWRDEKLGPGTFHVSVELPELTSLQDEAADVTLDVSAANRVLRLHVAGVCSSSGLPYAYKLNLALPDDVDAEAESMRAKFSSKKRRLKVCFPRRRVGVQ